MRVFYVVYPPQTFTTRCLDLMKIILNPTTKNAMHITIRGPYDEHQDTSEWQTLIRGVPIAFGKVGAFWSDTQNTVFFSVLAPNLQPCWHKPDYSEFTPHMTLYNGISKDLAKKLIYTFGGERLHLEFSVDQLQLLLNPSPNIPLLQSSIYDNLLSQLNLAKDKIPTLTEPEQLLYVGKLWQLCKSYTPPET